MVSPLCGSGRILIDLLPVDRFGGAIISIGPRTDAVLARWQLNASLIPHLRVLVETVCSSQWEEAIHTRGLTFEQSASISRALYRDIVGQEPSVKVNLPTF